MNYDEKDFFARGTQPQNDATRPMGNDNRYETQYTQRTEINEPTVIGKGARITGTIEVAGDLLVQGEVKGDITCQNKISVTGVVEGNIVSCDAMLDQAIITGDVKCTGDVKITDTAVISGNCDAVNIICGGRIKGDVNASDSAIFEEKAALIGNLSAHDIEIQRGAVLQGSVNIRQEVYFDTDK